MALMDFGKGKVRITSLGGASEIRRLDLRVRTLLACIEGTVPGNRGFGLSGDYLDEPEDAVASVLAGELQERLDSYIPEASVREVAVTPGLGTGEVSLDITIERRAGA